MDNVKKDGERLKKICRGYSRENDAHVVAIKSGAKNLILAGGRTDNIGWLLSKLLGKCASYANSDQEAGDYNDAVCDKAKEMCMYLRAEYGPMQ
jgi:hypothetical protein